MCERILWPCTNSASHPVSSKLSIHWHFLALDSSFPKLASGNYNHSTPSPCLPVGACCFTHVSASPFIYYQLSLLDFNFSPWLTIHYGPHLVCGFPFKLFPVSLQNPPIRFSEHLLSFCHIKTQKIEIWSSEACNVINQNVKHNHSVHLSTYHLGIKIIKEIPTLSHLKAEFIYEIYCWYIKPIATDRKIRHGL